MQSCFNCHGPAGKGAASYPKISGKEISYVTAMLETYRDGIEVGPNSSLMIMMAMPLTDEEISNLFKNSHATLIHSEHNLGIKIKLIQALHQSRWIIADNRAVVGIPYSVKDGILTYSDPKTFIKALDQIHDTTWNKSQATELLNSRKSLLSKIQGSLDL